mmetsp:Transcript_32541/g.79179  ORF Transcript_32541/g.79179 Transcript_32541/m.79179 type:complete len:1988 (-) Transcript_32541:209-6172(-)
MEGLADILAESDDDGDDLVANVDLNKILNESDSDDNDGSAGVPISQLLRDAGPVSIAPAPPSSLAGPSSLPPGPPAPTEPLSPTTAAPKRPMKRSGATDAKTSSKRSNASQPDTATISKQHQEKKDSKAFVGGAPPKLNKRNSVLELERLIGESRKLLNKEHQPGGLLSETRLDKLLDSDSDEDALGAGEGSSPSQLPNGPMFQQMLNQILMDSDDEDSTGVPGTPGAAGLGSGMPSPMTLTVEEILKEVEERGDGRATARSHPELKNQESQQSQRQETKNARATDVKQTSNDEEGVEEKTVGMRGEENRTQAGIEDPAFAPLRRLQVEEANRARKGNRRLFTPLKDRRTQTRMPASTRDPKTTTRMSRRQPQLSKISQQYQVMATAHRGHIHAVLRRDREIVGIPTCIALGRRVIVVGCSYGYMLVFDRNYKQIQTPLGQAGQTKVLGKVTCVDIAPSGSTVAAGHAKGAIVLWDLPKRTALRTVTDIFTSRVSGLRFFSTFAKSKAHRVIAHDINGAVTAISVTKGLSGLFGFKWNSTKILEAKASGPVSAIAPLLPPNTTTNTNLNTPKSASTGVLTTANSGDSGRHSTISLSGISPTSITHPLIDSCGLVALCDEKSLQLLATEGPKSGRRFQSWPHPTPPPRTATPANSTCALAWTRMVEESSTAAAVGSRNASALHHTELKIVLAMSRGAMLRVFEASLPLSPSPSSSPSYSSSSSPSTSFASFVLAYEDRAVEGFANILALSWLDLGGVGSVDGVGTGGILIVMGEGKDGKKVIKVLKPTRSQILQSLQIPDVDLLFDQPTRNSPASYANAVRPSPSGNAVLMIGLDGAVEARARTWMERIELHTRRGKWIHALALALDFHEGVACAPVGLPNSVSERRKAVLTKCTNLLLSYTDLALGQFLTQEAKSGGSIESSLGRGRRLTEEAPHFRVVGAVVVDFCLVIGRPSLLFDRIYRVFVRAGGADVLLDLLEPFILNGRLKVLPKAVFSQFATHYIATGRRTELEQCVLGLDPGLMDTVQVLRVCEEEGLWSGLIHAHITRRPKPDYTAPITALHLALTANANATNGGASEGGGVKVEEKNHGDGRKESQPHSSPSSIPVRPDPYLLLLYVEACFRSLKFPKRHGTPIEPARCGLVKAQVLSVLFEAHPFDPASLPEGRRPSASGEAFPIIKGLARKDLAATLAVLDLAFEATDWLQFQGSKQYRARRRALMRQHQQQSQPLPLHRHQQQSQPQPHRHRSHATTIGGDGKPSMALQKAISMPAGPIGHHNPQHLRGGSYQLQRSHHDGKHQRRAESMKASSSSGPIVPPPSTLPPRPEEDNDHFGERDYVPTPQQMLTSLLALLPLHSSSASSSSPPAIDADLINARDSYAMHRFAAKHMASGTVGMESKLIQTAIMMLMRSPPPIPRAMEAKGAAAAATDERKSKRAKDDRFVACGSGSESAGGEAARERREDEQERVTRQRILLELLAKCPEKLYDPQQLLAQALAGGLHQVRVFLLRQKGDYVSMVQGYLNDPGPSRKKVFSFIRGVLEGGEGGPDVVEKMRTAVLGQISQLVECDQFQAARLVIDFFADKPETVISKLNDLPELQFKILRQIMLHRGQKERKKKKMLQRIHSGSESPMSPVALEVEGDTEALLEQSGLRLSDELHRIFIRLLCKFDPRAVYPHLTRYHDYDIDSILALCLENHINDATAYLLERTGDMKGALELTFQEMDANMERLKKRLQHSGFLIVNPQTFDPDILAEYDKVVCTLIIACGRCKETVENEVLWFMLLDKIISYKPKITPTSLASDELQRKCIQFLVKRTLEEMFDDIPLDRIVQSIFEKYPKNELADFRNAIQEILDTSEHELSVRETASRLQEADAFASVSEYVLQLSKATANYNIGRKGGKLADFSEDLQALRRRRRLRKLVFEDRRIARDVTKSIIGNRTKKVSNLSSMLDLAPRAEVFERELDSHSDFRRPGANGPFRTELNIAELNDLDS